MDLKWKLAHVSLDQFDHLLAVSVSILTFEFPQATQLLEITAFCRLVICYLLILYRLGYLLDYFFDCVRSRDTGVIGHDSLEVLHLWNGNDLEHSPLVLDDVVRSK